MILFSAKSPGRCLRHQTGVTNGVHVMPLYYILNNKANFQQIQLLRFFATTAELSADSVIALIRRDFVASVI